MNEQPRTDANGDEQAFTLTVEEAATLYEKAGFPRTLRAIQKYCARDDLLCIREQTTYGERFRITPASVARHIEQIRQLSQANGRDHSRTDANVRTELFEQEPAINHETTVREQPRTDAAENDAMSRYVTRLEDDNEFLRDQIKVKDEQIKDLAEHVRSTNNVIAAIARRLPLLGGGTAPSDERLHNHEHEAGDNKQGCISGVVN